LSKQTSTAKRHAKVEFISIAGVTARLGPLGLQMYAADYLSAAKEVAPPEVRFSQARIFLVCRALELALKAFLSLKGNSLEKLADGKCGHNLEYLLSQAKQRGLSTLINLEERHRFQICRASTYYLEKVFEYPALAEAMTGYSKSPDTSLLIDAAEMLIPALQEPCLHAGD
jgi:hypothetical protein